MFFVCPICNKSRSNGSDLFKHIFFEHSIPGDEAYDMVGEAIAANTLSDDEKALKAENRRALLAGEDRNNNLRDD